MKNGLVLSGGGARGFAHLGVLHALDELGIHIDIISGASAGSIAGAFYFSGHQPGETVKFIQSYRFYQWARFLWRKPGLLNMEKVGQLLAKYLPDTFEKLDRPLIIATTDILKGELRYFNSGKLIPAVCASACIPIMFEPIKIDDSEFIDGGILNNFPVEPLLGKVENIIGVHVNPIHPETKIHFKNIMDRSMHLSMDKAVREKEKLCRIFIEPKDCGNFGILDLSMADKIFKVGYDAAMEQKDKLLLLKD
jgi:NTE family protein